MRSVAIGDSLTAPTTGLLNSFMHTIGVSALNSDEGTAAVRSFNKYGRLARERIRWPSTSRIKQVIPDIRVRSVQVGSGGTGYTSAPTVTIAAPGSGTQATGTATIDSNGAVNGVAVTNEGSGYVSAPAVTFSGGGGSGADATSTIIGYIDHGSTEDSIETIGELFRVTVTDPYSQDSAPVEIPFKTMYDATDYGTSLLINRSSTAPVWITYRFTQDTYTVGDTDFPYVWAEYVIQGAYADWLRANQQNDKAQIAERNAEQIILKEIDKIERQQQQDQHTQFTTHQTLAPYN